MAREHSPTQDPQTGRSPTPVRGVAWRPVAATILLILVTWNFHFQLLPVGAISHPDEFLTLDRSVGFARHHDWWNVYTAGEVTFKKPPLQYWMTASLLQAGLDMEVALRLPSMLFALGCLGAAAVLAWIVLPQSLWAMPAAVLLYASSGRFWDNATSALLDAGATFFSLAALVGAMLALRRPRWWYVTAAVIGLGALQKAPVGLVLVALYLLFLALTCRWHPYRPSAVFGNRHFRFSVLLAAVLLLVWPAVQLAQHGPAALVEAYGQEMVGRFAPSGETGMQRSLYDVLEHLIKDEIPVRGLGFLALLILPWWLRRFDLLPLPLIVLTYLVSIAFATGYISHRYSLIFLPYLAVALAAVAVSLPGTEARRLKIVAAISILSFGPLKFPDALNLVPDPDEARRIEILAQFGKTARPEETLVFCNWDKDRDFPPGALSYYGAQGRSFADIRDPERLKSLARPGQGSRSLRGLCTPAQLDRIARDLRGLERVEEIDGYVIWTAGGVSKD